MYGTTAVMREAEARRHASTMMSSSIMLSFAGGHVDWRMNTSRPRTFSISSTLISPSLKRPTYARPSGVFRCLRHVVRERRVRVARKERQCVAVSQSALLSYTARLAPRSVHRRHPKPDSRFYGCCPGHLAVGGAYSAGTDMGSQLADSFSIVSDLCEPGVLQHPAGPG